MNTESTITHLRRHGVVLPQIVDSSFLTMTNVATQFVIGKLIQIKFHRGHCIQEQTSHTCHTLRLTWAKQSGTKVM